MGFWHLDIKIQEVSQSQEYEANIFAMRKQWEGIASGAAVECDHLRGNPTWEGARSSSETSFCMLGIITHDLGLTKGWGRLQFQEPFEGTVSPSVSFSCLLNE